MIRKQNVANFCQIDISEKAALYMVRGRFLQDEQKDSGAVLWISGEFPKQFCGKCSGLRCCRKR